MITKKAEASREEDNTSRNPRQKCQKYSWSYFIYYIARIGQAVTRSALSKPWLPNANLLYWNDKTLEVIAHIGVEKSFDSAPIKFTSLETLNGGTIDWEIIVKREWKLLEITTMDVSKHSRHPTGNSCCFQYFRDAMPLIAIDVSEDSPNQWFHPILSVMLLFDSFPMTSLFFSLQ